MKDWILTDINFFFEHEEEKNYYKPIRVNNFRSKNYIKYESNGNRNKALLFEEYLNKIKPKKLTHRKIQLTMASNFISSMGNGEEYAMHSKSHNIVIMINDEAGQFIK